MNKLKDGLIIAVMTVTLLSAALVSAAWAFGFVRDALSIRDAVVQASADIRRIKVFLIRKFPENTKDLN